MVSLIVCARGLAVVLSRIGYSPVQPLLQYLQKQQGVLNSRHLNDDCK